MRQFYDSTTPGDLPTGAQFALRYVDGTYAETDAQIRRRCPGVKRIATVTVTGNNLAANMADCEKGDLTPDGASKWVAAKRAARKGFPTVYCEDSEHDAVIAACRQRGLQLGRDYLLFVANYNGQNAIPSYAVGHQYRSPGVPGAGTPGHYDISVVRDFWRGVDPRPLRFMGVPVRQIRAMLATMLAWAKAHPRKAKAEVAAFIAVLVAQPAVHAAVHHQPYTVAGIIAAVGYAAVAVARKFG